MKLIFFFKGFIIYFLFILIDVDCDSFELKNYLKRERERVLEKKIKLEISIF